MVFLATGTRSGGLVGPALQNHVAQFTWRQAASCLTVSSCCDSEGCGFNCHEHVKKEECRGSEKKEIQ